MVLFYGKFVNWMSVGKTYRDKINIRMSVVWNYRDQINIDMSGKNFP